MGGHFAQFGWCGHFIRRSEAERGSNPPTDIRHRLLEEDVEASGAEAIHEEPMHQHSSLLAPTAISCGVRAQILDRGKALGGFQHPNPNVTCIPTATRRLPRQPSRGRRAERPMRCRAATEGKKLSVAAPDHGAMQGARLMRDDRSYAPIMRPRAYPRILLPRAYPRDAGRERAGHMRGMRAGVASSVWARETISRLHDPSSVRTCPKCARPFGRARMFQVRTTLRACTTFSRAESHLSHLSHLIPPNPG